MFVRFEGDFDPVIYVVMDCSNLSAICLVVHDGVFFEEFYLILSADEVLFLVIDGDSDDCEVVGSYQFTVFFVF